MTFTELVIVYTSCGAPFAVERLLSDNRPNRASLAVASVVQLGFWPAFLLVKLLRVINSVFVSQKVQKISMTGYVEHAGTSAVNRELVALLVDSSADRSALSVKELLDRYAGLASLLKLSQSAGLIHDSEIARISAHPSPNLAAACRNRRNVVLARKHLASARCEFLNLIATALHNTTGGESTLSLALDFVDHLDPIAAEQIHRLAPVHSNTAVKTTPEGRTSFEETNAAT